MKYIALMIKRFADFSGRSTRKEFWIAKAIYTSFTFILTAIHLCYIIVLKHNNIYPTENYMYHLIYSNDNELYRKIILSFILSVLFFKCFIYISLMSLTVRRLHDSGYSGWFVLLPVVNLIMCCFRSEPADNRHGPYQAEAASTLDTPPKKSNETLSPSHREVYYTQLERLASLQQRGILSDEEFMTQKQKILSQL